MSFNQFSCCYYPTRVLLLDDNKVFLDSLALGLSNHQQTVQFVKPTEAAAFLKEQEAKQLKADKWFSHFHDFEIQSRDMVAHTATDVETFSIHKEIYNPHRFDEVSVMVVDYAMPKQNGIEFCRQFKDSPVKKILITGNATLETAIEAFNEGVIDKFLVKAQGEGFFETLKEEIILLQNAYFNDFSAAVMNQFLAIENSPFKDEKFCAQYKELLQGVKSKEYYMIDHNGSLLVLDEKAQPSWLFIKTEEELTNDLDAAKYAEGSSKDIIKKLQQRSHMVYLFTQKDYETSPRDWDKYLHLAQILHGSKGKYYYVHIDQPSAYDKSLDKVVSFNDYVKQLEGGWD